MWYNAGCLVIEKYSVEKWGREGKGRGSWSEMRGGERREGEEVGDSGGE